MSEHHQSAPSSQSSQEQGETDLAKLLSSMEPTRLPEEYVFVTVQGKYGDYAKLKPIASFQEEEGLTLVLTQSEAEQAAMDFQGVYCCLSLTVHSSLEAVGLTAAIATKLAEHHISANVIAGFFHDHIFVPVAQAEQAMQALQQFAST